MRTRLVAARLAGTALVGAVALGGCGSTDSDTQVERAEAQVAAKQRALSRAETDFKTASSSFCASAETYISALDRYGDVLHSTSTTVGDVREAGADLASPRQDALDAADKAVETNQAVVDAKNELAQAQEELKQAKKSSGGSNGPQSKTTAGSATAKPLVPSATTSRVKAAESAMNTAVTGITDQTPLVRASQEFNAAAVALEMSWLRLFADAGCLSADQQAKAESAVRDYTTTLQTSLSQAGYYKGEVDGVYGPTTVEAVKSLQQAHGIPVTGTVDKATEEALSGDLQKVGGAAAQDAVASTAALQQTLALAGFWDGPVDGAWTPELTVALKDFQKELGVKPTGAVDAATISAFEAALEAARQSPSASGSGPTESTEPTDTASPGS
jgi:peptidoglycan hydrolase-like protein with peptidoglycan-binding domain